MRGMWKTGLPRLPKAHCFGSEGAQRLSFLSIEGFMARGLLRSGAPRDGSCGG